MLHKKYEEELKKYEALINRKNEVDPDFYNGVYDKYKYPVLTREFAPVHWRYDLDEETNPYFMERLGINADAQNMPPLIAIWKAAKEDGVDMCRDYCPRYGQRMCYECPLHDGFCG